MDGGNVAEVPNSDTNSPRSIQSCPDASPPASPSDSLRGSIKYKRRRSASVSLRRRRGSSPAPAQADVQRVGSDVSSGSGRAIKAQLLSPSEEQVTFSRRRLSSMCSMLRHSLSLNGKMITKRNRLKVHHNVFSEGAAIGCLVTDLSSLAPDRARAKELLELIKQSGFMHLVSKGPDGEEDGCLYRFRRDDLTYPSGCPSVPSVSDQAVGMFLRGHVMECCKAKLRGCICSQSIVNRHRSHTNCFLGCECVRALTLNRIQPDIPSAVEYCFTMVEMGVLHPVSGKYHFHMDKVFCFWTDVKEEKSRSSGSLQAKNANLANSGSASNLASTVAAAKSMPSVLADIVQSTGGPGHASVTKDRFETPQKSVKTRRMPSSTIKQVLGRGATPKPSAAKSQVKSQVSSMQLVDYSKDEVSAGNGSFVRSSVITRTMHARSNIDGTKTIWIVADLAGFGFMLSGSSPAYVLAVDKYSPADRSGLIVGSEIVSVNGCDVSLLSHAQVSSLMLTRSNIKLKVRSQSPGI